MLDRGHEGGLARACVFSGSAAKLPAAVLQPVLRANATTLFPPRATRWVAGRNSDRGRNDPKKSNCLCPHPRTAPLQTPALDLG